MLKLFTPELSQEHGIHLGKEPDKVLTNITLALGTAASIIGFLLMWNFGQPPTVSTLLGSIFLFYVGILLFGLWFVMVTSTKTAELVIQQINTMVKPSTSAESARWQSPKPSACISAKTNQKLPTKGMQWV